MDGTAAKRYKSKLDAVASKIRDPIEILRSTDFLACVVQALRTNTTEILLGPRYKQRISDLPQSAGVYLFEITFKKNSQEPAIALELFGKAWRRRQRNGNSPAFYRGKMAKALENVERGWIPLYLGKERSIQKRVLEHIEGPINRGTWALRLLYDIGPIVFTEATVRVGFAEVPLPKHMDFLLEVIERALRNTLSPVIGKQ